MQQKSELPEGWIWTNYGSVLSRIANGTTLKQNKEGKGFPVTRIETISNGTIDTNKFGYIENIDEADLEKYLLAEGDILFSHINSDTHLGKTAIYESSPKLLLHGMNLLLLRPDKNIIFPNYLHYLSIFYRYTGEFISVAQHAVNQSSINQKILRNIQIPLPPLPEQHRIVSAIEALFALLDATNEKLDRVPEILKKFRQSVLAAACDGRLTEAWREEKGQNLECTDFLNNLIENFDAYVPSDYDPIIPQSIPEEWKMSRCYNLCDNDRAVTYGVIKLGPPIEDGIPTLRSSDVRWLKIDKNHVKCISPEIASNYSRTFLKGGEILVTVRGTLGGVAVVPQDMAGFNISREVAVVPLINGLNNHFFSYAIASKWSQNWLSEMTKGVAYTGINIKDLKNLPLPVPPFPEQQEIVRRVDTLFAFADSIEAKVTAVREKMEKLRQSILAKAFSGELVETEAEIARREGRGYETAEVLLERIKKERGKGGKKL